ncbi:MAG: LCP family protein [Micromonospora sp.]
MEQDGRRTAEETTVEMGPASAEYRARHRRLGRRRPGRPGSRRARTTALVVLLALVALLGGAGAGGWLYVRSLDKQVQKIDAFHGVPETRRPARVAGGALNFLVVGKDKADPGSTASRTDTIMLVHVPRSRDRAQVISIPRDTWTTIPDSSEGDGQPTKAKINAAYAWGGTPLLVRTIEDFTGVRLEHVIVIDFAGFGKIIDALGGVDVTLDKTFTSIVQPGRVYQPGTHRLDGAAALEYARARKQFADGDFSRMRHQQDIMAAVLREAGSKDILTDPGRLDNFLKATTGAVQVDRELSVFDTVWALRQIQADDVTMLTSPSSGTGMVGNQSVVFPDEDAAASLYEAVKSDTVDSWVAEHPN